jgi:hypothetical protein
MTLRPGQFGALVAILLLLAVAIVRTAVPDRSRMRSVSVEAMDIASEPIHPGQTVTREVDWTPPDDVYVVGWNYRLGATGASPELVLRHGETRVFVADGTQTRQNPSFFQGGAGYRVLKGERLTLRLRVTNLGAPGETHGASALIYFVPVEGN